MRTPGRQETYEPCPLKRRREDPETPICDFVRAYAASGSKRLHMPGHKGIPDGFLNCEPYDITEVDGADALYEADGIIAESERIAAELFGSGRTLYSTEGSSQCIRAMVHLAVTCRRQGARPVFLAARNAHRAFLYACALADADVVWLSPSSGISSVISCPVSSAQVEKALSAPDAAFCGVYITSPDYLGQMQDIAALAEICHRHGTPLLVDNAHGAYLHFLPEADFGKLHPLDLGADLCCDSAHKTLPVLTGGAYLHLSKDAAGVFAPGAKAAMALHGSTSPSYLTLCSLDSCNAYLAGSIIYELNRFRLLPALSDARRMLRSAGFSVIEGDPLHLSLLCDGISAGQVLRKAGIEPEYAGPDALILLFSPQDTQGTVTHVTKYLTALPAQTKKAAFFEAAPEKTQKVLRIREAVFAPQETVPAASAAGRIAAFPTAACPPAVPPVMPGERITPEAVRILTYYGYTSVSVVKE